MIIAICGFSGAGKTYLLNKLIDAESDGNWSYIDLDDLIVKTDKRSVDEMVEKEGWEYFRNLETKLLASVLQDDDQNLILSLGGGVLENNLELIKANKNTRLVWLKVPFEVCFKRISNAGDRPLTKRGRMYLKELYDSRVLDYQEADTTLLEEVVNNIKNVNELLDLLK